MKRGWKLVGIAALVAILGAATVGAVAYAQTDTSTNGPFDFATKFKEALAGVLGISVEKYDEAVGQAQTQVVDQAVTEGWLTQDQADLYQWKLEQAPEGGMGGFGKGMRMGGRGMGPMGMGPGGDTLVSVAADKLGMKVTELLTELQNEKSIADVAKEKGVDTQTIVDAYVAQAKETLDQAVADGKITQKQADYQLEQMQTRVTEQLESTGQGFPGRGGRHGGEGMGFPGMDGF
jgi:hypothetical protein